MKLIAASLAVLLCSFSAFAQWQPENATTGPIYYNGGNVGIGEPDPRSLLHISSTGSHSQLMLRSGMGELTGLAYAPDNASLAFDAHWQGQWIANHATAAWLYKTGSHFSILGTANNVPGTGNGGFNRHMDIDLSTGNMAFGAPANNAAHFYFIRPADPLVQIGDGNQPGTADRYLYLSYVTTADYASIGGYRQGFGATNLVLQRYGANVGIGIPSPQARLHVGGDILATGNISANGAVKAKYQDLAEWVPATGELAAGTVVVLDPSHENRVRASGAAYDSTVAGVVSEQPGVLLGEPGADKAAIATTGRVKVRVDATSGPIRIGDLLVTSGLAGVAMKSEPVDVGGRKLHQPGTIIGKALQSLDSGQGEILVLLSLQ
jgi:hypothetical protein